MRESGLFAGISAMLLLDFRDKLFIGARLIVGILTWFAASITEIGRAFELQTSV